MKQPIHFNAFGMLFKNGTPKTKLTIKKVFLIMKIVATLLLIVNLHVSAFTMAQKVTIVKKDVELKEVFKEIRAQTGFYFIYSDELLSNTKNISPNLVNVELPKALSELFKGTDLTFSIEDKIIVVKPKSLIITPQKEQVDKVITGKVIDAEDGTPLPGVSVRVKGSNVVAVTNTNGVYSLKIKDTDQIIQFSYIGYSNKEIKITATNKYDVSLVRDAKQLEEVQIAYGTSTKRDLTSSVTQITAKDIEKRPISNLNAAIVGASPGVQTNAGSGQPGEGPDIRVRGFSSITNSNDPLYVLDGAPYDGVISNINTDDIESISILKDAAATALYGARAANGIILITTKVGKKNKNNISVKFTQAFSERGLPNYELVTPDEYYPLIWESLKNGSSGTGAAATQNLFGYLGWNPFNVANDEIVLENGQLNPNAQLLYPDDLSFKNELSRKGSRTDLSASLSGGGAKSDHYVSLNYLDENGYSVKSDFKRFSGRVRVNAQPKNWLKFGTNLFGNYTKSDQANESSGINENPFYVDLLMSQIYPVYKHDIATGAHILDANGNKIYDTGDYRPIMTGRNIAAETSYNINQVKRNTLNAAVNGEAVFLKDFKFTTTFSANMNNYSSTVYDNSIVGDAIGAGRSTRTNSFTAYLNFNQLLNYNKKINKHKIGVFAGHESYLRYYDYLTGARRSEITTGNSVLDNFTTTTNLGSYNNSYKTEGYFSKVDYNYDSRYIFSASFRRDGSSKFTGEKQWGNFYSVSGAYNIDQEKFFKVKWIDNLKIRGSFGEVGNDNISGYYASKGLYTLGYNNGTEGGAILAQVANENLQWETNINSDVAVEFSMFKTRLNGSFEAYSRRSKNLLFALSVPLTTGVLIQNVNFGQMRNRGLELQLNGDIIRKKSFQWNLALNVSTIKNKIISLPDEYEGKINGTKRYGVGRSIYDFYLRDWAGVNPATGNDMWTALDKTISPIYLNGDTLTSSATNAKYTYKESAIPDYYGSFNNTFSYKNFSLQVMCIYQIGGYTFDNDYQSLMYRGSAGRALHVDALNRWQNPGDITNVPRRATGQTMYGSDQWLTKADYLNLRTVSFTYNLPKKMVNRWGMSSARAYLNGENLFITSERKGMDPTQTYTGSPSYTYAPARIISLGINVTL